MLPEYIKNPKLLVGKIIKQRFRLSDSREIEWFLGEVLRVERENGRKSKFCIQVEGKEDVCSFTSLLDIEKGVIIVC